MLAELLIIGVNKMKFGNLEDIKKKLSFEIISVGLIICHIIQILEYLKLDSTYRYAAACAVGHGRAA